jgi:ribosomal protein S3
VELKAKVPNAAFENQFDAHKGQQSSEKNARETEIEEGVEGAQFRCGKVGCEVIIEERRAPKIPKERKENEARENDERRLEIDPARTPLGGH